jgi:hypothetical protein
MCIEMFKNLNVGNKQESDVSIVGKYTKTKLMVKYIKGGKE